MDTAKTNKQPYYIGLDMGTSSVGWAVTDASYNVVKKHGKALWGVRLFEEAQTAADRRLHRTARRRIQRRKQRLALLQELFAKEICKVDPGFFIRLHESRLWQEDKSIDQPNTLFNDEDFDDKAYHKAYPTIYHLRYALMTENKSFDVRLVYLAIHHIIKHRGHFLLENYDLSNQETSGFDESYIALTNAIKELLQKEIPVGHVEKIQIILKDKSLSKREKTEKILQVWDVIKDKQLKEVVQLICGGTANLSTLFMDESLKEALKVFEIKDSKISFSTAVYEEKELDLQSVLEQRFDLVYAAKMLYDWSLLAELMGDRKTLSEAKIAIYETHKKDLEVLKRLTRQDKSLYRKLFRGTDKDSYSAYVGSCMIHGEKLVIEKRGSTEEFYKFLKKEISKLPDCEDKIYVLSKIEAENFLPKAVSTINGIIPYQLQEQELDIILKKAEQYLPFLMEKDAYGTISEKIKQLLTFRIPFYVGPLNRHSDKSWAVHTDKEGRILPWNFNERINEEKSAEKFITRMTNKCTYLLGKDVLPKNSLLYTEYMLFNELNNVKIGKAGTYLTEEQKEKLWKELFLTTKKVTLSKFSKFLIKEGIDKEEAVEIKGLDGGFKSSLAPWIDLKNILGEDFTRDKAEEIIKAITLFSMDKKILKKYKL